MNRLKAQNEPKNSFVVGSTTVRNVSRTPALFLLLNIVRLLLGIIQIDRVGS